MGFSIVHKDKDISKELKMQLADISRYKGEREAEVIVGELSLHLSKWVEVTWSYRDRAD